MAPRVLAPRRSRRIGVLLASAGLTAATLALAAGPAAADSGGNNTQNGSSSTATAWNNPGGTSGSPGGSSTQSVALDPNEQICVTYTPPANQDPVYNVANPPAGQSASDGHSANVVCATRAKINAAMGAGGDLGQACLSSGTCGVQFGVWVRNPPTPREIAQSILVELHLTKPEIHTNPDAGKHLVVGLPTWFWIDGQTTDQHRSKSGVSLDAHLSVKWSTTEGAVPCSTAGRAYRPGVDDPKATPPCGYTFISANPGHTITADVTWTLTFSGPGGGGTLKPTVWTVTKPVTVDEVQTVN